MLTRSSTVQSMIPALWSTTPTAQALMPLIRFLPFNLDLQSFLNLPIYSTVVLPFMHLGNDHERPVQLKKSRCLAVALFLNFPGALVIWWVYSTAIHIPYSFCFFSFSWQHTCLTQRTSLFPLRKSLPLEQVRLGLWALCPSSVCIKLSSFVTLGSVSTWLV